MAYRFFADDVTSVANGADLITAAAGDTIIFARDARYAAMGKLSHVLAIGRGVSATINGELYSGDGPTIYGRLATSGYNDFVVGASGIVASGGSAAFSIAGQSMTLKNAGEISGVIGVLSTAKSATISNSGSVFADTGVSLSGNAAIVDNHGQIAGSHYGITVLGSGGGQQITNDGRVDGGDGTAINVRASGDVLVTNAGTVSGRTGINLDVVAAADAGERTVNNTGTVAALGFAIYGSAAADTLNNHGHLSGKVNLFGGDDLYDGRDGFASGLVSGGEGDDVILGNASSRNVLGGAGGEDLLTGGSGDDVLIGGAGADTLEGGDGFDIASYRDATTGIQASLYTDDNDDGDIYSSIEGLEGGAYDDTLIAGLDPARLYGGAGDDSLEGTGDDRLVGGAGDDSYYSGDGDRIIERANGGVDTVFAFGRYHLPDNVENLTLIQPDFDNYQTLTGNALANVITGNDGKEVLDGGEGQDILTGGLGIDSFQFSVTPLPANLDRITDFNSADDTIRLYREAFGLASTGTSNTLSQAAFRIGTGAQDADDRVIYDAATGNLFFDIDGVGGVAQKQFAHLDGSPTVANTDFVLFG